MRTRSKNLLLLAVCCVLIASTAAHAVPVTPTPGAGWGKMHRYLDVGNLWDNYTNRNYGGYLDALSWPGGSDMGRRDDDERAFVNYRGFVIGARDVPDPQFHDVLWPYMVGQRDGRNDGERGEAILAAPVDPLTTGEGQSVQIMYKGRLHRRTFRQAYPVITVDGVVGERQFHIEEVYNTTAELVGDEDDGPYQIDVIAPTIPCDLQLENYTWTRMGIASNRMVYSFVGRDNDDFHVIHWRLINDGKWGRLGADLVDSEGPWPVVRDVMMSWMLQWDRSSMGAFATNCAWETNNDSIWNYYGADYDGARTEDMRLVWVRDGDQDVSKFAAYDNGSTDDHGDPDPVTGELLSAKDGG